MNMTVISKVFATLVTFIMLHSSKSYIIKNDNNYSIKHTLETHIKGLEFSQDLILTSIRGKDPAHC